MRTDLPPTLHSKECNELIQLLHQCNSEHPFLKFFGSCSSAHYKMTKCLKEERLLRSQENYEKSLQRKEKLKRLFKEEREREKANANDS